MSEPTFTITLADLKALSDAMGAVDCLKDCADRRQADMVSAGHAAIIRTLGNQVSLVYSLDDEQQQVAA